MVFDVIADESVQGRIGCRTRLNEGLQGGLQGVVHNENPVLELWSSSSLFKLWVMPIKPNKTGRTNELATKRMIDMMLSCATLK